MGAPTRGSAASGKAAGSAGYLRKDGHADTESAAGAALPTLAEVVEDIGLGWAQLRAGFLGGGVWLADGSELLLISSVAQAVSAEWGLSHYERGMVVTIVFLGILSGNLISGPLGDSFGRREMIIISYFSIFVFSIMSSYSTGYWNLVIVRFFVGASFGLGQPSWGALCVEITPVSHRIAMNSWTQALFSIGEMYSAILIMADDPKMRKLSWRWLLQAGAVPALLFGLLASFFLNQSPSYLALHGRREEAALVLKSMRRDNGSAGASVDFQLVPQIKTGSFFANVNRQFNVIFSKRLRVSTAIVVYSCFTLNMVFYGCLYAFPQVLPDVFSSESGRSASAELLFGALWELPGLLLGFILGTTMPRKLVIKLYAAMVGLSLLVFASGCYWNSDNLFVQVCLRVGYYGVKCFTNVGFVVVYQYSIEIYPAEARVTGTAFNLAGGRMAGISAPLLFEFAKIGFGNCAFFYCCAFLAIINFLLVDLLPYETSGKDSKECEHHHEHDDYGAVEARESVAGPNTA
mmetsp:Transcript_50058/g.88238  ORF Transcript_50058/g.88238 Transcript_50058/m.88238 type:complete len:519 (-) Transcript_50058:182-1738(-)